MAEVVDNAHNAFMNITFFAFEINHVCIMIIAHEDRAIQLIRALGKSIIEADSKFFKDFDEKINIIFNHFIAFITVDGYKTLVFLDGLQFLERVETDRVLAIFGHCHWIFG
jgi:hypothetical protein